ncbi:replication protein C, IncQ-type [Marinobacterium stanieri]|uniref:Plasmid and phage iteron-binding protein n=1 Tax=Marinobacterium stanieri TaxID=49186 RepID=A0A1N6XWT7_9GAMM|nr:replication protein C, IncQ-type [Marinobacterium stanieri]SIR06875.1 plasmid and phage iteron-binding protein [Marinobacterium stanieri]
MSTLAENLTRVEYARCDPALWLASLFRTIYRGQRPGGLTIEHEHNGLNLKFNVWQALDTRDQSVLLAAIALAGVLGRQELHADIPHCRAQKLWQQLQPEDMAVMDQATVVKTTRYALLQAAGMADGTAEYNRLEDCLERLSMVGCRGRKDGYDWSMRLLSYAETPEGKLHIALNSRFAEALSGHHVYVSLSERRALVGDTAQLTHVWLSTWLRQGCCNCIRLDRLAEKVSGPPSKSASTNRSRRERVRKALQEIGKLRGWEVKIEGRGAAAKATIKRPSADRPKWTPA